MWLYTFDTRRCAPGADECVRPYTTISDSMPLPGCVAPDALSGVAPKGRNQIAGDKERDGVVLSLRCASVPGRTNASAPTRPYVIRWPFLVV